MNRILDKYQWIGLFGALGLAATLHPAPAAAQVQEEYDRFGHAVAAGDFNGDGVEDLAIGTPGESVTRSGID